MATVVLDTNVAIYLLEGRLAQPIQASDICVSVITEIELLGYRGLDEQAEESIRKFLTLVRRLPLDDAVTEETILVRRSSNLKIGDAIIAATARVANAELLTHDSSLLALPNLISSAPALK